LLGLGFVLNNYREATTKVEEGLRKNKKCKVIKSRGGEIALVVGEDIAVNQILDLFGRTLVGKRVEMDCLL